MKKLKDFTKSNQINNKKRDRASMYLAMFFVLLIAVGARMFMLDNISTGQNDMVAPSRPVELSFSDVIRRADDIKTMKQYSYNSFSSAEIMC